MKMIEVAKATYIACTWAECNELKQWHARIMRLYRLLLPPNKVLQHPGDLGVLVQLDLDSPEDLLRVARLRTLWTLAG